MKFLVTGGTGFVGLNLVQQLMAAGWDVTALHRPSADLTFLKRFQPRLAVGSITDETALLALPLGGAKAPLSYAEQVNGLTDQRITVIARGAGSSLWVGTKNGLNRLDLKTRSVERIARLHLRRNWHRERVGSANPACEEPSRKRTIRYAELRGGSGGADRVGAIRAREGFVHRRGQSSCGQI